MLDPVEEGLVRVLLLLGHAVEQREQDAQELREYHAAKRIQAVRTKLLAFLQMHPWLVKWMGEDFLQGFFPGESYEDKRFRMGCWPFLLGLFTLNVFPLGIILLGIGFFMILSSDYFKKLTKGK